MGLVTQQDPIGIAGGLNLYGYANGDPVNFSDPFGLCGIAGAAASVAIGAGIALATGAAYGLGAFAFDAGTGAACSGVLSKLGKLGGLFGRRSAWALGWASRGAAIERQLGGNLPAAFPVIDRWVNGVATSIKSIDLGASSYQSGSRLLSRLNGYIDDLASFDGAAFSGTRIDDISSRVLQVAIPGAMTDAQRAAFDAARNRAAEAGVELIITVVR